MALRQWMLLNKHVSLRCLITLLGVGTDRMIAKTHGRVDIRYRAFGQAPKLQGSSSCRLLLSFESSTAGTFQVRRKNAVKGMTVNAYFLQLYQNAAGMLPNKSFVGNYVWRLVFCFQSLGPSLLRFGRSGHERSSGKGKLDCFQSLAAVGKSSDEDDSGA